jgi:cytoskeletal protein RodZ
MHTTGRELQYAREQRGLSAETIAQRTRFKLYRIVALEQGDFDNLPHGIYLDAIVRAYAHEVGIDPEPMVERVRAERGKRPGDLPIPFEEPVDFAPASPLMPSQPQTAEPSRTVIALSGLALFALLGWGAYLYEATDAAKRNIPGKIYAALTARVDRQAAPMRFAPDPVPTSTVPASTVTAQNAVRVTNAPRPAPPRQETTVALEDVTGSWRLATQVESSSYARYEGMLLGYELDLQQEGDRVSGVGRKIIENGRGIYSRGQTPIAISGAVEGDQLMLSFVEGGAQRSSRGAFVLQRQEDGTLRGRFTSNAAKSAGSAEARRVS